MLNFFYFYLKFLQNISVQVFDRTITFASNFNYTSDLTPVIDSFEPTVGSAALKNRIRIKGSKFSSNPDKNKVEKEIYKNFLYNSQVFIGDQPCKVINGNSTFLECETFVVGVNGRGVSDIAVFVDGIGKASYSSNLNSHSYEFALGTNNSS